MDDSKIIELFFERSERAIVELSEKYGRLCKSVSMNVLGDERDAEECVNDAYLKVWNAIPPNCPDSLKAFVCRLVRRVSVDRYKHDHAQKRKGNYAVSIEELENLLCAESSSVDEIMTEELSKLIDAFLDTLSKTNRMLFVRRYWYLDSYEILAELSGLREGAVRTRLNRIREKLKAYLKGNGVTL